MDRVEKTNPAVPASMRKATAAAMPNTIASTTVSGSSIMRELLDNHFIAYRFSA